MGALTRTTPQGAAPLALVMDADAIIAQRGAIASAMKTAMRDKVDYGTIPGTPKPTLFKPGSEKLLSMFHLSADPEVEDLSTPDTIRYRVRTVIRSIGSGNIVGYGVGEASSAESKYQWRAAICKEEFESTPANRRRIKWNKGYNNGNPTQTMQVRTEMEDVANTVLKMAKKRSQIDATLTVTAASDIFTQDMDVIDGYISEADADEGGSYLAEEMNDAGSQHRKDSLPEELPRRSEPRQSAPQTQTQQHKPAGGPVISEAQGRRLYAKTMAAIDQGRLNKDTIHARYRDLFGSTDTRLMPVAVYNGLCDWLDGKGN